MTRYRVLVDGEPALLSAEDLTDWLNQPDHEGLTVHVETVDLGAIWG